MRTALASLVIVVVCAVSANAIAGLCGTCAGRPYTADIGKCVVCGGTTTSGMLKLCEACGRKLGQCEVCRAPLKPATTRPATQSATLSAVLAALGGTPFVVAFGLVVVGLVLAGTGWTRWRLYHRGALPFDRDPPR